MARKPDQDRPSILVARPDQNLIISPDEVLWKPQPGQQVDLMYRYENEILIGGEKGSGKSNSSMGWMIRGNKFKDPKTTVFTPTDVMYINNKNFRGAVIRKNEKDLTDWFDQAEPIYRALGAVPIKSPFHFSWGCGARVDFGHMADSQSYMRFTGGRISRLFWDEITFQPEETPYEKMYSSIRSPDRLLIAQILLAANPEGPGLGWVKNRFLKARDKDGKQAVKGKTFYMSVHNHITGKTVEISRVYLPWQLAQNKILLENDPLYPARLAAIGNESLRKAYLYGDWDAAGGSVFGEFRPKGPVGEEPPEANHVYEEGSVVLQPWWPRHIGMDWAFQHNAALHKFCSAPNGRLYVYDGKVAAKVGSRQWGAEIARWCLPELAQMEMVGVPPSITVFLSPDAFGKKDESNTFAENIQKGAEEILGLGACALIDPRDTNVKMDPFAAIEFQGKAKIIIRMAMNQRKFGVDYLHELFRWHKIATKDQSLFDPDFARKIMEERGAEGYFKYVKTFVEKEGELLPKMQISSRCAALIEAIPTLSSDPDEIEDVLKTKAVEDDIYDSWRYGAMAHLIYKEALKMPAAVAMDRRLSLLRPGVNRFEARDIFADEEDDNDAPLRPMRGRTGAAAW